MSSRLARRLWDDVWGDVWGDRAGTSAVEFAIIAPVFLAMLFGVIALGWALHCNESVDYATQVVARGLIANPSLTLPQLQSQVQTNLSSIADPSHVSIINFTEDPATASPRMAQVTVAYTHNLGGPFIPNLTYTYDATSTVTLSP